MDLLERYLHSIRAFLPSGQQDDIMRELRENLLAEIEDQQERLGRTLTDAEMTAFLKRHGHPVLVASRYRPNQYLIGPVTYPFYLIGLRFVLIIAGVLALIQAMQRLNAQDLAQSVPQMIVSLPGLFLQVGLPFFGILTLAAIGVEWAQVRFKWWENWDPQRLPEPKGKPGFAQDAAMAIGSVATGVGQKPNKGFNWSSWSPEAAKVTRPAPVKEDRLSAIAAFFGHGVGVLWWALLPKYPWLGLGPVHHQLEFGPVFQAAYTPVLMLGLAGLVVQLVPVFLQLPWVRRAADLALSVLSLLGLQYFLSADIFLVAKEPATNEGAAKMVEIVNTWGHVGVIIASIVMTIKILFQVVRLFTGARFPQVGARCVL